MRKALGTGSALHSMSKLWNGLSWRERAWGERTGECAKLEEIADEDGREELGRGGRERRRSMSGCKNRRRMCEWTEEKSNMKTRSIRESE